MGFQLTVTPDSFVPTGADGLYQFYYEQVIELTVQVTSGSEIIQGGELVYVYPVSMDLYAPGGMVLRGYAGCSAVDGHADTVSAAIVRKDDHTGVATLQVLVAHAQNYTNKVWASLDLPVGASAPPSLQFDALDAGLFHPPILNSGFTLPIAHAEPGPAGSCGNYIRYQFEVVDPSGAGLQHMRITLTGQQAQASSIGDVLLYPSWESDTPLVPRQRKSGELTQSYVDLLTDAQGYAEVYLCAKAGTAAVNNLAATAAAQSQSVGLFVITDFAPQDGLLAPEVDGPVPLDREATAPVSVDNMTFAKGQQIYWYCNRRYQGFSIVGDDGKAAHFPLPTFGLRSDDYGPQVNTMLYVAPQGPYIGASETENFQATGTPPAAMPPAGDKSLPAPGIAGDPDGWPINIAMVRERLRLRIPLCGQIHEGDVLTFDVYLNGFRVAPDDDEPVGGRVAGPTLFTVTCRMLEVGYAEWLLPELPMLGYGQMGRQNLGGKAGAQVGDVGVLAVSYQVYRGVGAKVAPMDVLEQTPLYGSEVLCLGLDTVGPDGSVPGAA